MISFSDIRDIKDGTPPWGISLRLPQDFKRDFLWYLRVYRSSFLIFRYFLHGEPDPN